MVFVSLILGDYFSRWKKREVAHVEGSASEINAEI